VRLQLVVSDLEGKAIYSSKGIRTHDFIFFKETCEFRNVLISFLIFIFMNLSSCSFYPVNEKLKLSKNAPETHVGNLQALVWTNNTNNKLII